MNLTNDGSTSFIERISQLRPISMESEFSDHEQVDELAIN